MEGNKITGLIKKIVNKIKIQFFEKDQTPDLKNDSFIIEDLLEKIETEENKKKVIKEEKIKIILDLAEQAKLKDDNKKQLLEKFNKIEVDLYSLDEKIKILKEDIELLEFENERIIAVPTKLIIRKLIRDKFRESDGIADDSYHIVNEKFSDIVHTLSKSEIKHLLWDGIINRKLQLTPHGFRTVYKFARDIGTA